MVDHDQKGIKTIREGKVSDQITGDLLKGVRAGGQNGEKWGTGWVSVDLVLLARGASLDITANVRGEAWPPKFRGNKLASFENTWVTHSRMVMVSSNNRMAKVSISRDIDMALGRQDASIIVPAERCDWKAAETLPGRAWRASRTSGSEAKEEQSLSVREELIRLTKSASGRRVTASLSMSEAGM